MYYLACIVGFRVYSIDTAMGEHMNSVDKIRRESLHTFLESSHSHRNEIASLWDDSIFVDPKTIKKIHFYHLVRGIRAVDL